MENGLENILNIQPLDKEVKTGYKAKLSSFINSKSGIGTMIALTPAVFYLGGKILGPVISLAFTHFDTSLISASQDITSPYFALGGFAFSGLYANFGSYVIENCSRRDQGEVLEEKDSELFF